MKTIEFNGVKLSVNETKHTKTGEKIWLVNLVDRVDRATFTEINDNIKEMGGRYSRGFGYVFKEEPEFEESEDDEDVDYNELSRQELRELCKERDIEYKVTYGKDKLIELLEEADEADDEDEEDDGEEEEEPKVVKKPSKIVPIKKKSKAVVDEEEEEDEEENTEEEEEVPVAKPVKKATSKAKGFTFEFKVDEEDEVNADSEVSYKDCEKFINKLKDKYEGADHQEMLEILLKACKKDEELRKNIIVKDYEKCLRDGAEAWLKSQGKTSGNCICTAEQITEHVIEIYKKKVEKPKATTTKSATKSTKKPLAKATSSKKTIAKKATTKKTITKKRK